MLLWPWVYKVLFESKKGVFKSNAVNTLNCARRTLSLPAWVEFPCFLWLFSLCPFPVPMLLIHPSTPFSDMLIPPSPWQYSLGRMGKVMFFCVSLISFPLCEFRSLIPPFQFFSTPTTSLSSGSLFYFIFSLVFSCFSFIMYTNQDLFYKRVNKLSQKLAPLNNIRWLSYSFWGSEIWVWFSWVL